MATSTLSTSTSGTGMSGPSTFGTSTLGRGTSCDRSAAQVQPGRGREPGRWTVGFVAPAGRWEVESGHRNLQDPAASRVHRPDGGYHDPRCHKPRVQAPDRAEADIDRLKATVDGLHATPAGWWQGRVRRVRELQRRMGQR